jgi:hypothetical protein
MRVVVGRIMAESSRTCSVAGCTAHIRDHNQTGLCQMHGRMRKHRGMTKSIQAENAVEAWTPDPTQPRRWCQWCRQPFIPAGRFNRYFCSPACQDAANRELGYAYRANAHRRRSKIVYCPAHQEDRYEGVI